MGGYQDVFGPILRQYYEGLALRHRMEQDAQDTELMRQRLDEQKRQFDEESKFREKAQKIAIDQFKIEQAHRDLQDKLRISEAVGKGEVIPQTERGVGGFPILSGQEPIGGVDITTALGRQFAPEELPQPGFRPIDFMYGAKQDVLENRRAIEEMKNARLVDRDAQQAQFKNLELGIKEGLLGVRERLASVAEKNAANQDMMGYGGVAGSVGESGVIRQLNSKTNQIETYYDPEQFGPLTRYTQFGATAPPPTTKMGFQLQKVFDRAKWKDGSVGFRPLSSKQWELAKELQEGRKVVEFSMRLAEALDRRDIPEAARLMRDRDSYIPGLRAGQGLGVLSEPDKALLRANLPDIKGMIGNWNKKRAERIYQKYREMYGSLTNSWNSGQKKFFTKGLSLRPFYEDSQEAARFGNYIGGR